MAQSDVDTSKTVEIAGSSRELVLMVLGSLVFVFGGLLLAYDPSGMFRSSGLFGRVIGFATVAFFGYAFVVLVRRLYTQRGTVVSLSPEGLKDIRISSDVIPWSTVASLTTWEMHGQKVMIVGLKPGEEEKLTLTRVVRMTRGVNAALGADGLAVASQGISMRHDGLMRLAIAYAERYSGGEVPSPVSPDPASFGR
jgi:hypothetical protein